MKMSFCFLIVFIISVHSFACSNTIPLSEAVKAVALQPNAGARSCKDLPDEPCLCFDGVDWETADLVDGVLVVNQDKLAAKKADLDAKAAAENAKVAQRKLALDRLNAVDLSKVTTVAQLKAVLQDLLIKDGVK